MNNTPQDYWQAVWGALGGSAITFITVGLPALVQWRRWKGGEQVSIQIKNANDNTATALELVQALRTEFNNYRTEAQETIVQLQEDVKKSKDEFKVYKADAELRINKLEKENRELRKKMKIRET